MSTSQATCEAMWLRTFFTKLDFKHEEATIILIDSKGSISFIKNPIHHNWLKHFNIRHHYVRELVHVCCNPNLGLATKARACEGVGQEGSPVVTFHAFGSAKECDRMNPHTPK
jgi:hypothetical protein